jgi:hypothetical protein
MNPLSDRINNYLPPALAMAACRELKAQGKISLV